MLVWPPFYPAPPVKVMSMCCSVCHIAQRAAAQLHPFIFDVFTADGKSAVGAETEGSEAPYRPLKTQALDQPQALQQVPAAGVPRPWAATGGGQQHQAAGAADRPCQAVTSSMDQQQQDAPRGNMAAGISNVQQPATARGYVRQQAASWNKVYANAAWQSAQVQTAGCLALQKLQALCLQHYMQSHTYK